MRRFKLSFLSVPLLIFGLALSGCDSSGSGGGTNSSDAPGQVEGRAVVGILLYNEDIYILNVIEHLEALLSDRYDLIIRNAKGDQITQNAQIDELLAGGANILAINLVEPQTAGQVVDSLKRANVPGIFFNREPDVDALKEYSHTAFVGTVIIEAGEMQGEIIVGLWEQNPQFDRNGNGVFEYVMFQGEPDNTEALSRTEYSVKQARSMGVNMKQLGQTYICNWKMDLARQAMGLTLANGIGEIELVIANNDAMALGAIEALQEAGYNLEGGEADKFIPVVGVDAIPQAVTAIENGTMSATVNQDDSAMAEIISALIDNAVAGKDFLENTDYKWDESGVAVRMPYSPFGLEKADN